MTRKLLFILRHEPPEDELKYILRIARYSLPEKTKVNIKILLLRQYYLWDAESWHDYNEDWEQVQLGADMQQLLDLGVEVAYDNSIYYPKWEGSFDINIPGTRDYANEYGRAVRFRESGIKRVDPYEYVADAVSRNYEIIKW